MHPGWYVAIFLFLWVFTSFTSWHIWKHVGKKRRDRLRMEWISKNSDLEKWRDEWTLVNEYGKPPRFATDDECMKCVFWPIYIPGYLFLFLLTWCYLQYTTALKRIAERF